MLGGKQSTAASPESCESRSGNLPLDMIITFSHKFSKSFSLSRTHTHSPVFRLVYHMYVERSCGMFAEKFRALQIVYNLELTATTATATETLAVTLTPAPR
ncbi:hypothetical protein ACLKA6_010670 [Drosophila palustris]